MCGVEPSYKVASTNVRAMGRAQLKIQGADSTSFILDCWRHGLCSGRRSVSGRIRFCVNPVEMS